MSCVAFVEEGEGWKEGTTVAETRLPKKKKSDQQFIVNHQEHNHSWKVWIDMLRPCYEMCHVL